MHRGSVATLVVAVTVIAGIVAAEYYFFEYRPRAAEAALDGGNYGADLPEVSQLSGDAGSDSKIIECQDPEIGTFYTDAASCEEAEPPDPEITIPTKPPDD
jgi:hypothetical protein